MENTTIGKDFAIVHNDDTSSHKSKSFSLSPPLENFDQSIQESQAIQITNQKSGADDGAQHLHQSKSPQIKNISSHNQQQLETTAEVVSSTTGTISKEKDDTATESVFEYPIDYSKKENSDKTNQLNEIVKMKSPGINEETPLMQGTVLNLSKEAGAQHNSSSSNLPSLFLQSNSPSPATIPLSLMAGKAVNGSTSPLPSLNFGQRFSPLMNQTVPGTNVMIPLPYENLSPTLFSGQNFPTSHNPIPSLVPSLQLPVLPQITPKPKATRPFKAYPKDPLSFPPLGLYGLASSTVGTGGMLTTNTEEGNPQQANQAYTDFRKRMLVTSHIGRCKRLNIGNAGNNSSLYSMPSPSMSLSSSNGTDEISSDDGTLETSDKNQAEKGNNQLKDDAYWERRRKNNLAAKRSRDARRAKEDEIAIRAAFLEQENLKLRFEVCALKNETAKLRCMLYS